jgi:hypothetical protein
MRADPDWMHAAIEYGTSRVPSPYELKEKSGRVNGAVYTPFVRVAFAARALTQAGRPVTIADIPSSAVQPVTWFAMRWGPEDQVRVPAEAAANALGVVLSGPHVPEATQPVWTSRDLGVLTTFGAPVPFDDAAIVAAFRNTDVRAGLSVFAFVMRTGPRQRGWIASVRGGHIEESDLAVWR